MSIYDNEIKIYPDLNPTAPQEPKTYRSNKLFEIEAFFLNKIKKCEQKAKKIKRSITIWSIADASLITSTLLTGGISIAALASGVWAAYWNCLRELGVGRVVSFFPLRHPPH